MFTATEFTVQRIGTPLTDRKTPVFDPTSRMGLSSATTPMYFPPSQPTWRHAADGVDYSVRRRPMDDCDEASDDEAEWGAWSDSSDSNDDAFDSDVETDEFVEDISSDDLVRFDIIPRIVLTPPPEEEAPTEPPSVDYALLSADPWSFPAQYRTLSGAADAVRLRLRLYDDRVLRRRIAQTCALARRHGLEVPAFTGYESRSAGASRRVMEERVAARAQEAVAEVERVVGAVSETLGASFAPPPKSSSKTTSFFGGGAPAVVASPPPPRPAVGARTSSFFYTPQAAMGPVCVAPTSPPLPIPVVAKVPIMAPAPVLASTTLASSLSASAKSPIPTIVVSPPPDMATVTSETTSLTMQAPIDVALLEAVPWDYAMYAKTLGMPAYAAQLVAFGREDAQVRRRIAQTLALARKGGIPLRGEWDVGGPNASMDARIEWARRAEEGRSWSG